MGKRKAAPGKNLLPATIHDIQTGTLRELIGKAVITTDDEIDCQIILDVFNGRKKIDSAEHKNDKANVSPAKFSAALQRQQFFAGTIYHTMWGLTYAMVPGVLYKLIGEIMDRDLGGEKIRDVSAAIRSLSDLTMGQGRAVSKESPMENINLNINIRTADDINEKKTYLLRFLKDNPEMQAEIKKAREKGENRESRGQGIIDVVGTVEPGRTGHNGEDGGSARREQDEKCDTALPPSPETSGV